MQDVISFDTKKQHKTNKCRVKFSQLFFLLTLLIAISSVPATGFAQVSSYPDEISGEASVEVADDFETGKATYRYFIIELQPKTNSKSQGKSRSLSRTEVFFSGKAHEQFKTGKKVKVRGKRRSNGRGIDFDSLESLEPEPEPALGASNAEASSEAAVASPEIRKILTLLVSFQDVDVTVGANAPNLQDVKNIMFHNAQNVSHFYDRASLGTLTIPSDPNGTGGDAVYGPYTIDYTFLDGDSALCDVNSWQDAALTAWENDTGYSRSDYRHHSFIFPNYWDYGSNRNCGWAGYANVGCGTSCWAFNADPVSILHGVIVHELGHNFTFGHARTDPDNDGVKDVEYGDLSDMMGSSRNWMKFNPPHHEYTGWYDPVSYELRTVPPSSTLQSFDLIPVDESDTDWPGLRSIKTARDDSSSYYLSYRRQAGHYNEVTSSYTTGVSLHWRFNSGSDAYASYFVRMIEPGEVFVDPTVGLIVKGIGPSAIDDGSGNFTTVFTVEVCNDTCDTLIRPTNLAAQGAYPDTILLTWEDNSYGEDGFAIEYSVDGSTWNSLDTTAADATDYVHSGLSAGTTSYYRVQAYRGASEASEFSGTSSATTPPVSGVFAFPIISGDDDVEQMSSDGQMYFTSVDIDLGLDSWRAEQHLEGLRFQNISIPQGSTVSSAYIRYRASSDGTGSSTITISVEDTANAPEFSDSDYYLDDLDFSATTIPWILGDWSYLNYYDTPDLTALVQPIINKTGWVGGNSIAFVNQGTQTGTHAAYAFNSTSGNKVPATLYIDYTWNPTANQSPAAAFTFDCTDLDCSFTDTSTDGDGTIDSWLWDFGDINTSSNQNPVHTYATAGVYNVSLTVTDSDGATDNVIFPVTTQLVSRGPYLQTLTEDSIIVRWRTELATDSVVRYGLSDADLSSTTTVGGMTTEHTVTLTGLSPQTEYFYSIGDSGATFEGDASFHFTTAPAAGTSVPTRFWVIGDSGTADANARAVRDRYKDYAAATKPSEFMLMLGDNAYNDGFDSEYQAAVFDTYPVLLRQLPVWPTLGNHDGHQADSATQTGPYYDIFDLPTAGEAGGLASGTEAYYSYDYGDIHFVVLDSYETDRSAGGNMMSWLEADLVINDKPWVIAFWHHPPYTKGSHDSDTEGQLIDMRQNALPLLEAYGVDLVLSGHSHSYERSMLLDGHYGGSTTLDVASMVLNAGAGRIGEPGDAYEKPGTIAAMNEGAVYAVAGSSGKISGGSLDHPAMFISLNVLGSMVVDVDDDQLDAVFIDHLGEIRDEFTILKTTDVDAPQLSGVRPEDVTHVLVDFTERLDSSSAETVANYSIGAVSVSAAELLPGGTSVRLTVSTLTPGAYYLLTVNNVQDENSNVIAANSQAGFYYVLPTTVDFQASDFDASFREANPTVNYGSAEFLEVDGGTSIKHVLIGWDLSSIPANALIESASIHLTIFDVSTGSFTCNVMMTDWVESEVTWDNASAGVPWATPGATGVTDRGSEVLCDTFGAGSAGPLTINLNTPGIAQVQRWIDGTDPNNYGFMLGNPTSSDGADFRSREWGTAAERPRFEVTYSLSIPAPNSPTGLQATPVSSTQINLDWVDNSINESGFQIERSPNGSTAWTNIASVGPNVTVYSNTGLTQATTYYYRIYAENEGGNSGLSNAASDTTLSNTYKIGGTVFGLAGTGLVLQNNTGDNLPINVDGGFTFSTELADGSGYAVTVLTHPEGLNQTCSVTNSSGTLAGANITQVSVNCTTIKYTVGGHVTGLAGTGLVLQNNTGDNLPINVDGGFTFSTELADGSGYAVTVLTHPEGLNQKCSVTNSSGTLAGANITQVSVNCTTNKYTVGGNVTGLAGTGLVLQNNTGDNLPINVDGGFTFSTELADDSGYAVSVLTQPEGLNQTCSVTNGSGTLAGANITQVSVNCTTNKYTVGGNVTGLAGTGLVLQNNTGDNLPINVDGEFTFATELTDGSAYVVSVLTQPSSPKQNCAVTGDEGTLSGADVIDVTVVCSTDTADNELRNIATRADVRTGNEILIGGFVIAGDTQKCVVVQGLGGSVAVPAGVTRLADPVLVLKSGQTTIAQNDNWQLQDNPAHVQAIQNAGRAPNDILEAAIYRCLDPGAYTALVTGYLGSTGVGMVAVYDADDGTAYLKNIATRSWVGTGHTISIAGFVVTGNTPKQILIRGLGPSMESKFPPGSPLLWDPQLRLYRGPTLIETNDDWEGAANAVEIGALPLPLPPTHSKEPAILMTLEPGLYTAQVLGVGQSKGIGNVAVYDLTGRQ